MTVDIGYVKQVGIGAAFKGASALRAFFRGDFAVDKKGARDLVTDADRASEKAIMNEIFWRFPDHSVMAEESGAAGAGQDRLWIVDPLDGTTNFAHGVGFFAVSIAFALHGEVIVGVVLNPETGELFTAVKDHGAELNGAPIRVSGTTALSDSLLATGFPYSMEDRLSPIMDRVSRFVAASRGLRRLGSAAMDLCYVACGRFDGFWEEGLQPWDTAAGMLIARQAGARVTDFSGNTFEPEKKELLATNGWIHNDMLRMLGE
ncbi:MAG: inositol monophosphatase family protein [Thermodesulfobacteriota bacterium]